MQQYLTQFSHILLFEHIPQADLLRSLNCLNAQVIHFEKGNIILHQGEPARFIGIILDGSVNIISSDISGNHTLVTHLQHGNLFAETFACAELDSIPASVIAAEDSVIMLLEYKRVITGCRNGCMAHSLLVTNLMRSIARKNLRLSQKLSILSRRSTRSKLIAYLSTEKQKSGTSRFMIPYDRQELADFLCVERSAMSAELSKMKKEGIISFRKNEFELLAVHQDDGCAPPSV
ncbi:MAG: Crp/Fnr family transcriptional regulator [Clostridia bacterium]|nr:Crp/Fnr family transcriptional regulator [Clostridia bacterium]